MEMIFALNKKDKNGSFTFDANSAAALVLFKCESVKRVQNWSAEW